MVGGVCSSRTGSLLISDMPPNLPSSRTVASQTVASASAHKVTGGAAELTIDSEMHACSHNWTGSVGDGATRPQSMSIH